MTAEMTAEMDIYWRLFQMTSQYTEHPMTFGCTGYPRLVDDVAPNNALLLADDSCPES